MGDIFTYSGIFAKVKAMSGRLLTDTDFKNLAGCSGVSEAIAYLKEHPGYQQLLENEADMPLHRGEIEKLLITSKYNDFNRLYRFANKSGRQFLKLYFIHYETEFLKYCLRHLFSNSEDSKNTYELQNFFRRYSHLRVNELLLEKDLSIWISLLDGSPYEKVFAPLKNHSDLNLFDYESVLDHYYFKALWKMKDKFYSKSEGRFLKDSLGNQIDLLNIQWIYRSRHRYHLDTAEILKLLIPINHRLTTETIRLLTESETKAEFEIAIEQTKYKKLFHSETNKSQSLEKLYYHHLIQVHRLLSKRNPYSPATLNTYLFLKEEEIRKLTIIIEGLRYQVPAGELISYIPLTQEVISI